MIERTIDPQIVIDAVAGHYRIDRDTLLSRSSTQEFAHRRYLLMWMIHHRSRMPFKAIARLLNRDKTLIGHGVRTFERRLTGTLRPEKTSKTIAVIDLAIAAKLGETPIHIVAMRVAAYPAGAHPFEIEALARHVAREWSQQQREASTEKEFFNERAYAHA